MIISGLGEESSNVGAVHKFSESEAAEVFEGAGPLIVLTMKLGGS